MNSKTTMNITTKTPHRITARLPKYRIGDRIGRPHFGQAHAVAEISLPQSGHGTRAMMNKRYHERNPVSCRRRHFTFTDGPVTQYLPRHPSPPGKSFTACMLLISFRAAFQSFWTIQESERS